jgi:prophage maintenance system killer protein
MENHPEIVIYESKNRPEVAVKVEAGSVWLTQAQLAELYDTTKQNVGQHIKNIFKTEELDENSVVKKIFTTADDGKNYRVNHYNLDMTISLGYRINSKTATQFRIWANTVLKKYLLNGVAVNERRLKEMNKVLEIVARSTNSEVAGVAELLKHYAGALKILEKYDDGELDAVRGAKEKRPLGYDEARKVLDKIAGKMSGENFARERGNGFRAILGNIYASFGGRDVYSTVESKAAHLLYFIVKDHPFVDGNKRSAAALFVYFLERNCRLRDRTTGRPKIENNALAAMTLMIALSNPKEKTTMTLLVENFLKVGGSGASGFRVNKY